MSSAFAAKFSLRTRCSASALDLARDIAINVAPLSVAYSKRLLWDSWDLSPDGVESRETAYHRRLMGAPDAREGVVAFVEKRRAVLEWSAEH